MSAADVTICIPTWQAEPFIARTLACARAQTHKNLRILVSVDQSTDGTEAICRGQAKEDPRLDIRVQKERLGWSANCNFLLDQVDTEFCFLYFHDDIIEPTCAERLLQVLRDHPEAQSAHGDVELFGNRQAIMAGSDLVGTATERLVKLLVMPAIMVPLRGLMRSEILTKGLRFPLIGGDGFWRLHPFLMNLAAAGAVRHVPEVLYRLWYHENSMTKRWDMREQSIIAGQQESARLCLDVIHGAKLSKADEQFVTFCLYVSMIIWIRGQYELPVKSTTLIEPALISPAFKEIQLPNGRGPVQADVYEKVLDAYCRLLKLEAHLAQHAGDTQSALLRFAAAVSLDPNSARLHAALGRVLSASGHQPAAAAVHQRARILKEKAAAEAAAVPGASER